MSEPLEALVAPAGDDAGRRLLSPAVGVWRDAPAPGALLRPGDPIGWLEVLGRRQPLRVPSGAAGVVSTVGEGGAARGARAVGYRDGLLTLEPRSAADLDAGATAGSPAETSRAADGDHVFRSPSSGRFFLRPAPGEPPFVAVGDVIEAQQTIGLLEVMKTFTRLHYGGPDLPAPARVAAVLAADGADLEAGDAVLAVEAAAEPTD